MKALRNFEGFLESLVEGSFRRLFRGRIEPVDLARRIARAMDDNKRVTWQRPLVPNRYEVLLAPADFADLQSFAESLQRELQRFATERAAERGYSLLGPAIVTLAADAGAQAGAFHVRASVVEPPAEGVAERSASEARRADDEYGQTRAMKPLEMPLGPTGFETIYLVGQVGRRRATWPISGARITIGRGLDNDIVLDDASVSRHHAEISREGSRAEVRDLGSTNGTWVNAGRVSVATVHVGDQLAFGAVQVEVARQPAE